MPVSQSVKPWLGAMNTPQKGAAKFVPARENRSAAGACVYTKSAALTIPTADTGGGYPPASQRIHSDSVGSGQSDSRKSLSAQTAQRAVRGWPPRKATTR